MNLMNELRFHSFRTCLLYTACLGSLLLIFLVLVLLLFFFCAAAEWIIRKQCLCHFNGFCSLSRIYGWMQNVWTRVSLQWMDLRAALIHVHNNVSQCKFAITNWILRVQFHTITAPFDCMSTSHNRISKWSAQKKNAKIKMKTLFRRKTSYLLIQSVMRYNWRNKQTELLFFVFIKILNK